MGLRPYLAFTGNCRAAFTRYQEVFGGELIVMGASDLPPEAGDAPAGSAPDTVMHAQLEVAGGTLMGADDPTGSFQGPVNGMCVNCSLPDTAEAKRVFDALADGGQVQMPLGETFFAPAFGLCTDRFGTPWMIMVDRPMS
jgi:PhnB protein